MGRDIKTIRPYSKTGESANQLEQIAAQRPNDMRVISQIQRNKLNGRLRNSGELYRALPTGHTDILEGDAEGDVVYDERKMWRAISVNDTLEWRCVGYGAKQVVFVNDVEDFGTVTNNRVSPDPTYLYMIDGTVDMGSVSIEVPSGGLSLAGLNGGRDVMILTSSEDNYTMFVSPSGSYSGDVVIESLTITTSGTSSQVFNLDNDGNSNAIDITGVNFTNCTSLGELTDYRQLLFNNIGFILIDDGLTFNGAWSGLACVTSIAILFPAGATLFKEGTSLTFSGSIRSDINFLSVASTSVLFDFQESNVLADSGLRLTDVRTTADDALPNISSSSVKVLIRDCEGIPNTYMGGKIEVTTGAATTFTTAGVPVKMAGTTSATNLAHFDDDSGTNNRLRYIASTPRDFRVSAIGIFSGTVTTEVGLYIRHYDASAASFVTIDQKTQALNGGLAGTRAENLAAEGVVTMEENDYIELGIANETNTMTITSIAGTQMIVSER